MRGGEPLATSRVEALQLTDRVFCHLKARRRSQNTERNFCSFLVDLPVFVINVTARVNERPWQFYFLLTTYLHFWLPIYVAFKEDSCLHAGKGNKEISNKERRKASRIYVVDFPEGIFS